MRMLIWILQKKIYNAYCKQTLFFVEKDFEIWDPRIHGPCKYLQSFYFAALIEECCTEKYYPLAMFRNGILKKTRSSYKGTIDNVTSLLCYDSEMASKEKNNLR